MPFTHNMADWLGFNIDKAWLEENIRWKDFGTGVRLGRLYREDACSLVLYEADSEVPLMLSCLIVTLVEKPIWFLKEKFGTKTEPIQPVLWYG